jgi:predicted nucleic acid-binding protein
MLKCARPSKRAVYDSLHCGRLGGGSLGASSAGNQETAGMLESFSTGASIEVPALWPLEVANALTVLERRGKLTVSERQTGLEWFRALPVKVDHEMARLAFSKLSELAATHTLSVYDAAYLELALRRRLPLGCKDGPLRAAAKRCGVTLWT